MKTPEKEETKKSGSVMVVGGGIGGMQAALDLANGGFRVHLVQKESSIGGTMSMLDKTFPTGDCAMCMLSPRLVEVGNHLNVDVHTNAQVLSLSGEPGDFTARIEQTARYVDIGKCTGCEACVSTCPVFSPSEYNQELIKSTAISRRYAQAVPGAVAVDKKGISPCRVACPAEVNAHAYVALIAQGRFAEALKVVRRTNPFPASCGRVCTHPCESDCRRSGLDEAVSICYLKRFLTDWEDEHGGFVPPPPPAETLEKVAVIGSGPAGMTAARDLALKGYQVTVFEKLPVAGGMLAVAIPEYRLPKSVLKKEIDAILSHGITLELNRELGRDFTLDSLREQDFRAFFVSIGAHAALKLNIPGEEEGHEGMWDCITFLRKMSLGEPVTVGKKVIVIGGGNAAIDSARTARRMGAEVTIVYRRTEKEMPANAWEIEEALLEGVKILPLMAPIKILSKDGHVTGIECLKIELGKPDNSGRRRPIPIEGSEMELDGDMIISAISQTPDVGSLKTEGLPLNRWNLLKADGVTLATEVKDVFAGGDVVAGPATVVEAVAMGSRAAESIHRYLRGEDMALNREPLSLQEAYIKDLTGIKKTKARKMSKLDPGARMGNFHEVELGLSEKDAVAEAKRCLNCSGCCECFLCVEACEAGAINHKMPSSSEEEIHVGAVILSPGADRYNPRIRGELGYGRWPNVITSLQFERILSASGPFKGEIKRPGDGSHPAKIAWIQCVGSRDRRHGNPWCSSVCCMYATKQAVIAKEHDNAIDPTIFYIEMRAFGKDFDRYVERAKNEYGVHYRRGMISAVREVPGTGDLLLRFANEDGTVAEEVFDLVVLSVGLEPHADAASFARVFDIDANEDGFAATEHFDPVSTSREGVFVAGTFQGPKDIPDTAVQGSAVAGKVMAMLSTARGSETVVKELPPERDVAGEVEKLGVFVCHCGINIAQTVNVPEVVEYVKGLEGVCHAENLLYACSQDSQEKIKGLVREKGLNRVVVASCTPRTHESLFQDTIRDAGLNRYLFDLADIREQCSWCHMGEKEKATEKAKKIVGMSIAKARKLAPVTTDSVSVTQAALVIGGGVAGMVAAGSLAAQGFAVHLVEKTEKLGGLAAHVYRTLDNSDVQAYVNDLIERTLSESRISVHLGTEVENTEGFVGNFRTTLADGTSFDHGAIIVATGGQEYTPTQYLYGQEERVITQRELEKRLYHNQEKPGSVYVMIQCVGSREEPENYCSRICCQDAMKNAIAIREKFPDSRVFVLYRDIRTYGLREKFYEKARDLGVVFIRYDVEDKPKVSNAHGGLKVHVFDPMLQREVELNPDFVVLSTGLRPGASAEDISRKYKLTLNPDRYFLEAHVKLRPVDFPSEGIFLCGLAHAPKNLDECVSQSLAAAGRAGVLLSKDSLGVSGIIAKHDRGICMSCLTCVRICPFGSPFIDEDGRVSHNEVKCMGCGICAGACPAKAFQVNNFKDEQILGMVDAAMGF